ncbi:MAG: prephenate dehydratase, partial [Ferruginibacter sp.]
MRKKVSIQGFEGCFHQVAAKEYYGDDTEVICCSTFKEVVKNTAASKLSDGGIMAIENSIAGSILPNFNLLVKNNVKIIGEVYLQIKQQLLVNRGVKLEDIKEVHSHYMAIQQCSGFLDKYNWKLVETEDTALSAKHIHQYKNKHAAAIAGKLAAEIYGLDIIAPNIQTLKNNYTRFLILLHKDAPSEIDNADKASVNFVTGNEKGSLAKVLTVIANEGVNLSKLQSMPIPGSHFKYSFHADMELQNEDQFNRLLVKLKSVTDEIAVLGKYKNG